MPSLIMKEKESVMRMFLSFILQIVVLTCSLLAQTSPGNIGSSGLDLGKWWKNSEIVRDLQLSGTQVEGIEQCFLKYRSDLANRNLELKRHEADLKRLMQMEPINEISVKEEADKVAGARLALEKTYNSMMISIRKALSGEQWEKLGEMRSPKVYTAGNGVTAPKATYMPLPKYTEAAKKDKIEGIVVLKAIIRKDGTVDSFRVIKGLGYGLDESAIHTIAKEWRFIPGAKNGESVDVEATIETSFRLF